MSAPWSIRKCRLKGCRGWVAQGPGDVVWHVPTHAEALAFVLARPEVRRRTSSAARAARQTAEALA